MYKSLPHSVLLALCIDLLLSVHSRELVYVAVMVPVGRGVTRVVEEFCLDLEAKRSSTF